ncbi:FK506-binding protein 2 [Seminavis robusta]|uniref:peptidylprolyl isomerase n=1 Tax=Seminavis robusta TaxID=568900 RepID=A0A9N8H1T6_9STRA|nr:FK506-binding protein 2 [Seminavis robusta]|eukprot:Sro23_g015650.1 FK506-binding protein 2 (316) ;mRNA; r:40138-41354
MLRAVSVLRLLLLLLPSLAEEPVEPEMTVNVYEGPSMNGGACPSVEDTILKGNEATIHYTVSIDASSEAGEKGRVLQTTVDGEPLEITLGHGEVIPGWDHGLMGLCKGDKAILVVPPHMAYGDQGTGDGPDDIPGDATLKFDVEIVSVEDGRNEEQDEEEAKEMFEKADKDGDGKLSREEFNSLFDEQLKDVEDEDELEMIHEQLTNFWNGQDKDEDGFLTLEEFLQSSHFDSDPGYESDPQEEFDALDKDGNGKLDKEEISGFFGDLGQEVPEDFWTHLDEDGDGFISFEEFFAEGDEFEHDEDFNDDEEEDEL